MVLDGGGSEANFRLLLQQGYQLHAKGLSSSRAAALAKKVSRWDAYGDIWLGEVEPTFDLARPMATNLKRDTLRRNWHCKLLCRHIIR